MSVSASHVVRSPHAIVITVVLGVMSAGLYALLFLFEDELTELASFNRVKKHILNALLPLGVALVFSLVHGAFTGHFWDLLGLRAKQK